MNENFPKFIQKLQAEFTQARQQDDLVLTAEEIADVLWLALHINPTSEERPASSEKDGDVPSHDKSEEYINKPEPNQQRPQIPADRTNSNVHLYSQRSTNQNTSSQGGKIVRMPTAPALKKTLALGRALRPLRRRGRSHKHVILNEQATVHQIAEMDKKVYVPVFEPAPTRWFEIVLVIDEGTSMIFWQQTITELCKLLERLGAFSNIHVWGIATDHREHVKLYARTGLAARERPERQPKELIDPTRHRLILVVTDCISPAWQSGKVLEVLEVWGQKNLVTLLQVLPQRLWPRTSLRVAKRVFLSASAPGMANTRLKTPELLPEIAKKLSTAIPVVTLAQDSLTSWAQMAMGTEGTQCLGVMFGKNVSSSLADVSSTQKEEVSITAEKRVYDFRATPSHEARKLAVLLSALPVFCLPIVYIIQQSMLPQSGPSDLAEVFLGGLLKESPRSDKVTSIEDIQYEFHPGVREALFIALSRPDEHLVRRRVSAFMAQRLGLSPDFLALVADSTPPKDFSIPQDSLPFAQIAARVWRNLGNTQLADLIEQQLPKTPSTHSEEPSSMGSLIKTPQELLEEAFAITDHDVQAKTLISLLPRLSDELQLEALSNRVSDLAHLRAWLTYLPNIPDLSQTKVIQTIVDAIRQITDEQARLEALEDLLDHLPGIFLTDDTAWQYLTITRSITHKDVRRRILNKLLEHVSAEFKPTVEREIQDLQPRPVTITLETPIPPNKNSRNVVVCPSCFEEIYLGDCRIISGISGKVLKPALKRKTRARLERLDSPEYIRESAHRECSSCKYLLPYNIELVQQNITLAVVADNFAGKSHYIAALLYQMETDWINHVDGLIRLRCLTLDVEKQYRKEYLDPLFIGKRTISSTQPPKEETTRPLIYELFFTSTKMAVNIIIYDVSGEVYAQEHKLVQFARFIFNTGAFIFVADPVTMLPILHQLPLYLQDNLKKAIEDAAVLKVGSGRRISDTLNSIISLFERYHKYPDGSSLEKTPVAVMVSKADLLQYIGQSGQYTFMTHPYYNEAIDLEDIARVDQEVRDLLRENQQGDLLASTNRIKRVKFFATSATGESPDTNGNFINVQPRRCLDPVLWILYQFGMIKAHIQ